MTTLMNRMKNTFLIAAVFVVSSSCYSQNKKTSPNKPWDEMKKIIKDIKKVSFSNKEYNVMQFGAQNDGVSDNTKAFKKAIEACSRNGGGKVIIPKGKYVTAAIHLENNVNLYLAEGSELLFSNNPKDYPLVQTSFEGTEMMNFSPMVYANNKTNIAITGKGILNGQASNDNWWKWAGKGYGYQKGEASQQDPQSRDRLVEMGEIGTAIKERVFGEGYYIRPNFLEFFECNTALIQGIKIINTPSWVIHPFRSSDVIIDGVTIDSHGPNNDGCDPEYSKNILIKNCVFNTGDDCIAIKSGRDADGRRVAIASENIVVQNCKMIDGHGGVVIGSEISAGVRNVYVENCVMDSPELERAIRIKTNSKRGGVIENIYVRNLEVGTVKEAVLKLNMFYAIYGDQSGKFLPVIRNVSLENVKVKNGGKFGVLADGYQESPIENITLKKVTIDKVEKEFSLKNVKSIQFIDTKINGKMIKTQ